MKDSAKALDVAMGMAADMCRETTPPAARINLASEIDNLVGYFAFPTGSDRPVMRWPRTVCERAGIDSESIQWPRSDDQRA